MLRVGLISYLNAYPFYYPFQFLKDEELIGWQLHIGRPATLNAMLRENKLDVSLISFMEYAKNSHLYELIRGLGLSSKGYVDSVKLFSRLPLGALNGYDIYTTNASATSVSVMEILLRENGVNNYVCQAYEASQGIPDCTAALAIGDEALTEDTRHFKYVYDLGELWHEMFERNIVFAVGAVRKSSVECKLAQISMFVRELVEAPAKSFKNIGAFRQACQRQYPDIKDPVGYLNRLHFSMGAAEEKDMEFFLDKATFHGLLESAVSPHYFTPTSELVGRRES